MVKLKHYGFYIIILLFVLLLALITNFRVVYPNQAVIVKTFNTIKSVKSTPGPVFKVPFIQSFENVDLSKIVYTSKPSTLITSDRRTLISGTAITYKITDIETYRMTVKNSGGAESRVEDIVYEQKKNVFAKHKFTDIIKINTENNASIQDDINSEILAASRENALKYGIEIVGIDIPNLSYPVETMQSIINTITAERNKVAGEIRSEANKQAAIIKAEANNKAAMEENACVLYEKNAVAKGIEESQAIYDSIYKTDSEFYEYFRSIKMWEKVANNKTNGEMTITVPATSPLGRVLLGY